MPEMLMSLMQVYIMRSIKSPLKNYKLHNLYLQYVLQGDHKNQSGDLRTGRINVRVKEGDQYVGYRIKFQRDINGPE